MKFNELTSFFMTETIKNLNHSMQEIHTILSMKNIRYVFIGGAILGKYGFYRMTEDVDILVHNDDKEKIMQLSPGYFKFNDTGRKGKFHKTNTLVDVLYSGDNVGESNITLPDPESVYVFKDGVPVLSLPKLIEFKLTAGIYAKNRLQDFGDIQRLIIHNKLSPDLMVFHNDELVRNKYKEIWNSTEQ